MGAGPGRCKKCSRGYQQVGSKCLGESSPIGGLECGRDKGRREGAILSQAGVQCGNHGDQHSDPLPFAPRCG